MLTTWPGRFPEELIRENKRFENRIKRLRERALDYPMYYMEETSENGIGEVWVSCMVKFLYEGVEYKRHHVESIVITKTVTAKDAVNKLIESAKLTIQFGMPTKGDEIWEE